MTSAVAPEKVELVKLGHGLRYHDLHYTFTDDTDESSKNVTGRASPAGLTARLAAKNLVMLFSNFGFTIQEARTPSGKTVYTAPMPHN